VSTATVRSAIATFFEGASITGLHKVHAAPPYWADGSEWDLAGGQSGAIAAVHLVADRESRITVPVLTGQKMVRYHVGLMVFYQWLLPSNTTTPVDEAAWADPLDVIIDGIKDRLRSDPNCGVPATIWQAAQDPDDVTIQRDLPRRLPGKILSWNVVEFSVYEVVTA